MSHIHIIMTSKHSKITIILQRILKYVLCANITLIIGHAYCYWLGEAHVNGLINVTEYIKHAIIFRCICFKILLMFAAAHRIGAPVLHYTSKEWNTVCTLNFMHCKGPFQKFSICSYGSLFHNTSYFPLIDIGI
jgi:hypothetical protein